MKAILSFKLPEEKEDFEMATKAVNYKIALDRVGYEVFRPHRKHGYGDPVLDSDEAYAIIDKLEEKFYQILKEEEISCD